MPTTFCRAVRADLAAGPGWAGAVRDLDPREGMPARLVLAAMLGLLFAAPEAPRPWHSIVLWWELRRVP